LLLNAANNWITDASGLAQGLLGSKITHLRLDNNWITDVSGLAQVLPQTQIIELRLGRNQISDADRAEIEVVAWEPRFVTAAGGSGTRISTYYT